MTPFIARLAALLKPPPKPERTPRCWCGRLLRQCNAWRVSEHPEDDMNHCGWCTAGSRAVIVAAVRSNPDVNLRTVAEARGIGYYYAEKVRAKARKLGCLTVEEPLPPPPRPVAWTLPPIGAVYVRTV